MTSMTTEQISTLLADPHVCVLAVAQSENRPPLALPLWYGIDPQGQVYLWTAKGSLKARRIRDCGLLTVTVQRDTEPYAYVSIEGTADEQPADRSRVRALVARYVPEDLVDDYLEENFSADGVIITISPTIVRAVDFSE